MQSKTGVAFKIKQEVSQLLTYEQGTAVTQQASETKTTSGDTRTGTRMRRHLWVQTRDLGLPMWREWRTHETR